jgi:hypothetical protein
MARTTTSQPVEVVEPAAAPAADPYAGHGGEYVLDMLTGERKPVTKSEEV